MALIRIGSRGSDLALWQAHHVQRLIEGQGHTTSITVMKTKGDRIDDAPFSKIGGKGLFTKELEDAQLAGEVDIAVHSMKDLGSEPIPGLAVGAMIGREDPRDLLIAHAHAVGEGRLPLQPGVKLGTSSARRQALARHLGHDHVAELRGNVPTRVQKLRDGGYDAIILAAAGIARLGLDLSGLVATPLDPRHFVPAPAQGMLAIQCRDEPPLRTLLGAIHTEGPARAVAAERWLVTQLDGGCSLPFGCFIREDGGRYRLDVFLVSDPAAPLTFDLEGGDPMALAKLAWERIAPHRSA